MALLALLMLHEARRPARLSASGEPVPLPEQDRSRWDHAAIRDATALLDRALARGAPGPLQVEAAIAATHCRAAAAADTEWGELAALYGALERLTPTPAVRVNRAVAVGHAAGPAAGLALLDNAEGALAEGLAAHPYLHLARGTLLAAAGRAGEAREALRAAERRGRNTAERRQIRERIRRIEASEAPAVGGSGGGDDGR